MTTQTLLFSPRFLDQHAGSVVRDPVVALVELVANAWDAGARRVDIDWPSDSGDAPFRIQDDGHGMTAKEFNRRWGTLAYDRTQQQGTQATFPPEVADPPVRPAFGRSGIGRHGVFAFGSEYELCTWRDGTFSRYTVRKGESVPLEIEAVEEGARKGHGTEIRVTEGQSVRLSVEDARREVGLRFLADPEFEVWIDGTQVEFADLPASQVDTRTLTVSGVGRLVVKLLDTRTTDKTARLHGIAWHVKDRLVGECSWKGTGYERFLDGRRAEAKRYTFIVEADPLVDAVRSDWKGFDEENPAFRAAQDRVRDVIGDWLVELTSEKRAETTRTLRARHRNELSRVGPLSREKWEQFVDQAQQLCPSLSERDLSALAGLLAKLEGTTSTYRLIHQLERLDGGGLDDLQKILRDWSIDTAKAVLDELKVRLRLLDQLRRKVLDRDTDEVHELQPLFHKGLWIFGPEFETIEFTSNEGMTAVAQRLFDGDQPMSRNRPDYVVLPDGTSGLYSYPRFDSDGGEIGVDRLVVVELKRPSLRVGATAKRQPWKYVKELYQKGLITDTTRVTCFVLGATIDPTEAGEATENNGRVRILPMTYDMVMQRAQSRLLRLYERVKNAPFLQDTDLEEFLEDPDPADPNLFDDLAQVDGASTSAN